MSMRQRLQLSLLMTYLLLIAPLFAGGKDSFAVNLERDVWLVVLVPMLYMLLLSLLFVWPWRRALRRADWPSRQRQLRVFATMTILSAAALLPFALGEQPRFSWFGLQLMVGWLAYWISLPFREPDPAPENPYQGEETIVRRSQSLLDFLAQLLGGGRR